MRNNVAGLCARVVIATLASLPVFAVAGGVASAAPSQKVAVVHSASAHTPAECTAIRQEIAALKAQRRIAQEELAHATPAEKPAIVAEIRELNAEIARLAHEFPDCLAQG